MWLLVIEATLHIIEVGVFKITGNHFIMDNSEAINNFHNFKYYTYSIKPVFIDCMEDCSYFTINSATYRNFIKN